MAARSEIVFTDVLEGIDESHRIPGGAGALEIALRQGALPFVFGVPVLDRPQKVTRRLDQDWNIYFEKGSFVREIFTRIRGFVSPDRVRHNEQIYLPQSGSAAESIARKTYQYAFQHEPNFIYSRETKIEQVLKTSVPFHYTEIIAGGEPTNELFSEIESGLANFGVVEIKFQNGSPQIIS